MLNASDILLCHFDFFLFLFPSNLKILDLFLSKWSYFSKFQHFFFRTEKMDSKFSVAKLCSISSCTLSASIGFIIFKFKRRIRTNKTSSFYPEVLQVGPAAVTFKCCFHMHLTLNSMQGNMWKKDCINYCRKKVNWFR